MLSGQQSTRAQHQIPMTTTIVPTPENYYTVIQQHQDHSSPYCTLQWRRDQLLVSPPGQLKPVYLPSLENIELLVKCLQHSPVTLIRIDPKLGEVKLRFWADACKQANKPLFLRIPAAEKMPKPNSILWKVSRRFVDLLVALVFLLAASPLMLVLALLISIYSPGPLFSSEWYIGERGKIFQMLKFRTTANNDKTLGHDLLSYQSNLCQREEEKTVTSLGRWMRKFGLDNLPQLLNILRGEMSLAGPRCWTLADALRLTPEAQKQLNKLPGMTGSWEVEAESNLLHLDSQVL